MTIEQFIRTDYPTVPSHALLADVVESIIDSACTVVVAENDRFVGLLSYADIIRANASVVGELEIVKPRITSKYKVGEVVSKMRREAVDVLAVYENEEYIGAVSLHELTSHLLDHITYGKAVFQSVVHDLRQSLTNLLSLNGLLKQNVQKAENREILEMAEHSCGHALEVLQELNFIEKLRSQERTPHETDLNKFIGECIAEFKGVTASKGIMVSTDLSEEPFFYPVDRKNFKRAIHNLISNAVKFSMRDGSLSISSSVLQNIFSVRFQDKGIGIPMSIQPFIFDKFSNASRSGTDGEVSTGLGLFFSKACIEEFGGSLRFETAVGEGTTFIIQFDRKDPS